MKPFLTFCFFLYCLVGGFAQSKGKNDCNLASHSKDADNSCYVSQLLSDNKIKKRVKVVSIPENKGNPSEQYTTLLEIETYNNKGKVIEKSWKEHSTLEEPNGKLNPKMGRTIYTYQADTILLERVSFSGVQDTLFDKSTYYYDNQGRLKSFSLFLKKANGEAVVYLYYDKYNRKYKSLNYSIDNKKIPLKNTIKYDCKARKAISKYRRKDNSINFTYTYIYNENNLLAEYYKNDKTDVKKYFYDTTGRIIKTVTQFPIESQGTRTQLTITSVMTYNDLGLIEKIEEYEKDVITQTTRFSYEN